MTSNYPWYTLVQDQTLEQGDFFFSCPIFDPIIPIFKDDDLKLDIDANAQLYDVIILSQSCDLCEKKIETVLACPHWPISKLDEDEWEDYFHSRQGKEDIRKGNVPGLHMIAKCDIQDFHSDVRVISFRQVFGLPLSYLQRLVTPTRIRLRLLPPYREQLAQAFARFIMRVGLPIDIPRFK